MNLPDHYLMTVALHAVVLSIVVFLAVLCLRKPQRVALTALCGTLAIAILPWFSAMRPARAEVKPHSVEKPDVATVAHLPEWTIVRVPVTPPPVKAAMPVVASSSTRLDAVTLVSAAWVSGGVFALGVLVVAGIRVMRWQRTLAMPDDVAWQGFVDVASEMPGRDGFRISMWGGSPCVVGFFKPLVVIPAFLLDPTRARELRWALRHELRHWRGSDSRSGCGACRRPT